MLFVRRTYGAKLATFGLQLFHFVFREEAGPCTTAASSCVAPSGRRRSIMPPSGACKSCGLNAWRPRWDGKASTCVACGEVSMVSPASLGDDASAAGPPAPRYPWEEFGRPTSPNGALFGERDNGCFVCVLLRLESHGLFVACDNTCATHASRRPCMRFSLGLHASLHMQHCGIFSHSASACAPNTTASTS